MNQDKYIWNEFKNDKDYALSNIYHQNIDFLFFSGKKLTNDENLILDVIQDLFFDLIKSRKKLGDTDNIRLYLLKSFRRKLFREMKKKVPAYPFEDETQLQTEIVFSIEEELINDEERSQKTKLICKGMQELNLKQREALYYKFTWGFDYDQICEIMSISYDTARKLVSRGINSLKKYIANNDLLLFSILLEICLFKNYIPFNTF